MSKITIKIWEPILENKPATQTCCGLNYIAPVHSCVFSIFSYIFDLGTHVSFKMMFDVLKCLKLISESKSIIVVGGHNDSSLSNSVEVIGDNICSIPPLPIGLIKPSISLTNDEEILACGGAYNKTHNNKECFALKEHGWEKHSTLIKARFSAYAMTMSNGVYLFGGEFLPGKNEFLPDGSKIWKAGSLIPKKSTFGCSVKISDFDVIVLGGMGTEKRIVKLNTKTNDWKTIGELKEGRYGHACAMIYDQIIVSGGSKSYVEQLTSTEVISLNDLTSSRMVGNLNEAREFHGLATAQIDNVLTLVSFGGSHFQNGWRKTDSIEIWNPDTETWSLSCELRLTEKKAEFGYLSIPSHLLCH